MTYVQHRGPIPDWIKKLRADGYLNIFEICQPDTLYGTEHLCGDWAGQLLIVAKDFAPADEVLRLTKLGLPPELVYRHNDGDGRFKTGLRTNRRLMKLLFGPHATVQGERAASCGALYVSACFLLKQGTTSSKLENWASGSDTRKASRQVLEHTIAVMPNLRAIACLGGDALQLLGEIYGFDTPSRVTDAIGRRFGRSIPVYFAPHPSRGSNEAHEMAWRFIKKDSALELPQ